MPRQNVLLITGASGHVGFRTLVHALRAGLDVRVTVRSELKAELLLSRIAFKVPTLKLGRVPTYHSSSLKPRSKITFFVVPDIAADRAYDHAMEDITHVIHIASPLVTGSKVPPIHSHEAEDLFIGPAVRGTINLLEAADRCGTVRRIVITSSIAALVPVVQMEGTETRPSNTPVRPTDRVSFTPGPYHSEFAAYANSKIAALDAAETWHKRECPAFDIIHLHPSFVLGRNDMIATPAECMKGTNAMVLAMLLGNKYGPVAGATVHVDDVARCHVAAAVDVDGVPGDASYILSQTTSWDDAKAVAASSFPVAMKKRLFVKTGWVETVDMELDVQSSLETFGLDFQGFAAQVKSLCAQFLSLKRSSFRKVTRGTRTVGWTLGNENHCPMFDNSISTQ